MRHTESPSESENDVVKRHEHQWRSSGKTTIISVPLNEIKILKL